MSEKIILIAAVAGNGVIGLNGDIPWRRMKEMSEIRKSDMVRFQNVTKNHCVITGRKNYESIPQKFRPLPDRLNIVVSRTSYYNGDNLVTARSLDEAVRIAGQRIPGRDIYVIGGGEIYIQTIGIAKELDITEIPLEPEGDTYFPRLGDEWMEIARDNRPEGHAFVRYLRR